MVVICKEKKIPYLDTTMEWDINGDLDFKVHLKPNSKIKYVNKTSDHLKLVIKEVKNGVLERLCKLTTMNEARRKIKIENMYPEHVRALREADLLQGECPTFGEIEERMINIDRKTRQNEREKDWKDKRNIFLCIQHSKIWPMPLSKIMQQVKDRNNGKGEIN